MENGASGAVALNTSSVYPPVFFNENSSRTAPGNPSSSYVPYLVEPMKIVSASNSSAVSAISVPSGFMLSYGDLVKHKLNFMLPSTVSPNSMELEYERSPNNVIGTTHSFDTSSTITTALSSTPAIFVNVRTSSRFISLL